MSSIPNISTKFESTSHQAADVTAALAGFKTPSAIEAYDRLQVIETATVDRREARLAALETGVDQNLQRLVALGSVPALLLQPFLQLLNGASLLGFNRLLGVKLSLSDEVVENHLLIDIQLPELLLGVAA